MTKPGAESLRLYKKEKLCSATAIEQLFTPGYAETSKLAYPLRMLARRNPARHSDAPVAFLISIPKKRLRHAVDRVLMRRRTREAYRLNHRNYALEQGVRLDVAFVYVAKELIPYSEIEKSMCRLLRHLSEAYPATESPNNSAE